jgi:hypothetical protein
MVELGVFVGVFVGVLVIVEVGVLVTVLVGVLVIVEVGVLVTVLVGVLVIVEVGVNVGVFVGVNVEVLVLVGVSVEVLVLVGVSVGVAVFVGVGVGVGISWQHIDQNPLSSIHVQASPIFPNDLPVAQRTATKKSSSLNPSDLQKLIIFPSTVPEIQLTQSPDSVIDAITHPNSSSGPETQFNPPGESPYDWSANPIPKSPN